MPNRTPLESSSVAAFVVFLSQRFSWIYEHRGYNLRVLSDKTERRSKDGIRVL